MNLLNIFGKTKSFIFRHKIISLVAILLVFGGGYWLHSSLNNTNSVSRYVLSAAAKETIISSITGTGQTSAVNDLDVKPKTSGDLTYVGVVGSQTITKGELIAKIDTTDAQQAVNNAQQALDEANVDLEKMKGVETDLGKLRGVTEKAQDSLDATYESGYNTVTNAFLNLPTVMTGLQDILYGYSFSNYQRNIDFYLNSTYPYNDNVTVYEANAASSYQAARDSYDKTFADFKTVSRTSSKAQIESIISETYDTIGKISQSVKDSINLIQEYQDEFTKHDAKPQSGAATHLSSLSGYVNTTNTYLSSLLSTKTSIESDKESLVQTTYDISDQENLVATKQVALDNAKKNLSYCYIYAPFSGVVSTVNVKVGDSVSSGTSLAKVVTKDVVAIISLNEVDASKVTLGQKVTTTFDAIDGLSLTGVVNSVDAVGTVSQGVVSYSVKITFDSQDSRLKPGMSVSSNIITETKQNVLTVPNSAVKSKNGVYYVLVLSQKQDLTSSTASQGFLSATAPTQKTVEVGTSDDTNTEITSGLAEGDQVVSRTISATSTTTSSTSKTTSKARQTLIGGGASGAGGPPN